MEKQKSGLHKEISSIFSGVPIPKKDDAEQPSSTVAQEAPTYGPPSHLSKKGVEAPPVLNPPVKDIPAETPKTDEKTPSAPAPEPVIKIRSSRPEWLERIQQIIQEKLFAPRAGVSSVRQKATVVMVPIMFIGMVLAFYKVLGGGTGKTTEPHVIQPSNAIVASAGIIDWQIPEVYPKTLRDPMQFVKVVTDTVSGDTPNEIEIKGILYSEQNPSAIIGTEIIHEGGTVSGATVVKINKDSIEFERDGKRWTQKVK